MLDWVKKFAADLEIIKQNIEKKLIWKRHSLLKKVSITISLYEWIHKKY